MASILTAQQRAQLHQQFDEVLNRLPAKLENLSEAEEQLESGMRQLAQASLQSWADSASTASPPPACPDCGHRMRHRGLIRRSVVTLHGVIRLSRPRRRCDRCGKERYPHDGELCFQSHGVSWRAAAKVAQWASLVPSYELACRLLAEDFGIELSKHSIEQIVRTAGGMLLAGDDAAREACFTDAGRGAPRGPKASAIASEVVAVYADGTMIHTEGQWHEIRVGRVIAWDVQGQRQRRRSFARFLPLEAFGRQLFVEAHAAG